MKYVESNIPSHLRLQVVHLHQGNCDGDILAGDGIEPPAKYVTIAKLLGGPDKDTEVARGESRCSLNDNPCRATGRAIAIGRALKDWHELDVALAA